LRESGVQRAFVAYIKKYPSVKFRYNNDTMIKSICNGILYIGETNQSSPMNYDIIKKITTDILDIMRTDRND